MQALNWLSGNKAVAYGAAAVALIVAALLVLLVFRLAFGRRLRMSGGRGRQLRLGIVDAFDLDRQRQLVIVRRDNVEHLVMIGGPNDILIESQIVRAETRDGRQRDKDRDKERREKDHIEPTQLPAAQPPKPAAQEPQLPLPPFVPEAPAAEEPVPPRQMPPLTPVQPVNATAPAANQPAGRAPFPPIGPRRSPVRPDTKPTPAPSPPPAAATPPLPEPVAEADAPPPVKPPVGPAPTLPSAAPGFARWRPGQTPTPAQPRAPGPTFTQSIRPEPAPAPVVPAGLPSVAPRQAPENPPANTDVPAVPHLGNEDLMVSLEEEMAKLLGRAPDKP